ncbi:hypothetical protein [Streptomyces sp. NPDC005283]|uniref:hypothetical protein n=1 Tax=Streptomyces sp. NPDC005283 TaxID=3156871 RepID=UPI003454DAAB
MRRLIDIVFTDDMLYFDSLPEAVDRELGTPLSMLGNALDEGGSPAELLRAARLVDSVAAEWAAALPADLARLIDDMRFAMR